MTHRITFLLRNTLFIVGLLWGGYTLFVYLGAPIHQLSYLTQSQVDSYNALCQSDSPRLVLLCRGVQVFPVFLQYLFLMASPFLSYALLSLFAFIVLLVWCGYKTGRFSMNVSVRPVIFVALFACAVWLMATTLSLGSLYHAATPDNQRVSDLNGAMSLQPFRRYYEPNKELYGGASDQALAALKVHFDEMLSGGCLKPLLGPAGDQLTTQSGSKIYNLTFLCMQGSIFSRVGLQFILVLLFLFNLIVTGRFFLERVLRVQPMHPMLQLCSSVALGALVWVSGLWFLSLLSLLLPWVIRFIFVLTPLMLWRTSREVLVEAMTPSIRLPISWKNASLLLGWLLVSYLALNFLNVVRPFPIGWDDLGSYLNRPRLLASYGSFIPSMSQFQWEYLTSLGFLLFGYDNVQGATLAMQINWTQGLIAVLVVFTFARLFFGKRAGFLSAMLYYFLPMTGHFSFADMKIDNAVFFTSSLGILLVFAYLFKSNEDDEHAIVTKDARILLLAGLLLSFSFAIKPTAILAIFLCTTALFGELFGVFGLSGMIVGSFAILSKFGPFSLADISQRSGISIPINNTVFFIFTALLAIGLLGFALYRIKKSLRSSLHLLALFTMGIVIAFLPWGLYNSWTRGSLSVSGMLSAQDNYLPQVFMQQADEVAAMNLPSTIPVRTLPPELKLDINHPACKSSARAEELDRYWGFTNGISHYLTLPWRQVMNVDAYGYYVTLIPALLLVILIFFVPAFWSHEQRWLRFLTIGTFIYLIQWAFVANGVMWYGIGMFLGFVLMLEALVVHAPQRRHQYLFSILLALSLCTAVVNRLWQFDSQKNIFEYPMGKVSAEVLQEMTIPNYDDIRKWVTSRHDSMPDTPYTYRIGTFISYFIPKNREIFPLADHQLGFFTCLNQELDHALTLKRLKALGFNSMIFDTNTYTIEKDPNGPLHRKVNDLASFINDPALGIQIAVNDPGNGIAYMIFP